MRRIFTVDPTGRDERIAVSRGTQVVAVLTLETVIRTSAYRGSYDQRVNGRLCHGA